MDPGSAGRISLLVCVLLSGCSAAELEGGDTASAKQALTQACVNAPLAAQFTGRFS
jgi:hypothetical protein